jgi:hypothetical protein
MLYTPFYTHDAKAHAVCTFLHNTFHNNVQNPTTATVVISGIGTPTSSGYAGYVTVTITTTSSSGSGFISYTKDGKDPACRPAENLQPTKFILDVSAEIRAVLCQGTSAGSAVTSQRFFISTGPVVLVSMTINGISSASQVTDDVEARLVAAYAQSLGISQDLVKLDAVRDARRRLLAVIVTFRLLASDAAEATKLAQKAQVADMQVRESLIMS